MTTTQDTAAAPPLRLTGACACCGAPTGSLFAMGHDARFRGVLQRALATGDWDAAVPWYTASVDPHTVTVADALARVASLIGRDWSERVAAGAARLSKRPAGAVPLVRVAVGAASRPFVPAEVTDARIDELMYRLNAHPLTGQWGWLALPPEDANDLAVRTGRRPESVAARVQHTRRFARVEDRGEEPSSLVDFFVPELGRVVSRVDPAKWRRDESARS